MTIEEMQRKRIEYGYSYKKLSELSGVPESTIQKIFRGQTERPRYETVHSLETVLSDRTNKGSSIFHDAAISYGNSEKQKVGKHGTFTVKDYEAIEDRRVELIDGVIYDMTAPATYHQLAVTEIIFQIKSYIKSNNGSCIPFVAPTDVQLDLDDKTMVQPDIGIICNKDLLNKKRLVGAPDFVLEIVSPSTSKKDYYIKLNKYMNAGVREYWIVDPYQKRIVVYYFEGETGPQFYPITASVPVNIYEGKLQIDLSELEEWLPDE